VPRLSVIAIRAALVYLLAGFTLGALLLANKGIPFAVWVWGLLPAHIEFLFVGWTTQLALGMAFWILPRFTGGSRGNEKLAAWAIAFLNLGILLVAAQSAWPGVKILPLAGRAAEIGAAVLFALHAWKRVRPTY
jgi:hypothetical protein